MASSYQSDDDDDDDNIGLDDEFFKQMEALKHACQLRDHNDASEASDSSSDEFEDSDDEVLRSIQKKFNSFSSTSLGSQAPGHETDDEEDEDSILRSVQRFCGSLGVESVGPAESQGFEQSVPQYGALFNALNQNRSCQRLLRSLMHQVELKQAENKVLQKRVKSAIGAERSCKRRSAGLFSNKLSNPILTFMSNLKRRVSRKPYEAPADAPSSAPAENPDVAKFRMLKEKRPVAFVEKKWTAEEKAELAKGVKQQIQELRVRRVMENMGSRGLQDTCALDAEIKRIGEEVVTAQDIQDAVPTVDWTHVARVYVVGRSPAECKLQWLNYEDPSINKRSWSKLEDKKLLKIAQEHNCRYWDSIGRQLGTNRTPAQCLARYQRSLNASIMKSSWTEEEDKQLRGAVARLGENDWQTVAATLEGRTGPQCSNRWYKVLHPTIQRKGRWDLEEDKRLKWAVSVYGPQKWRVIASHVPGRTDIQCRERWVNVLDPSVNISPWTTEEDEKLEKLVEAHGQHRWAKVAKGMDRRTDSQCWRRWKNLHPENQASFHLDNQIKKAALPSNWVGRVKERPKLGVQDFIADDSHMKAPKRRPGRPTKSGAARTLKRNKKGDSVDITMASKEAGTTSTVPVNSQSVDEFVGLVRMFDSFCKYASKLNPDIGSPSSAANAGVQLVAELQGSSGAGEELIPLSPSVVTSPVRGDGAANVGHDESVSVSDAVDAQVAAATRAILSWPFALGMVSLCAATNNALVNRKRRRNLARNKDVQGSTSLPDSSLVFQFGKKQSKIVVVPASSQEESSDAVLGSEVGPTRSEALDTDAVESTRFSRPQTLVKVSLVKDATRRSKPPKKKKRGIEEIVSSLATDSVPGETTGTNSESANLLSATPEIGSRNRRRKRVGPPCELPGRDEATDMVLASESFERHEARKRHGKNNGTLLSSEQSDQQDGGTQNGTGKRRRKLTSVERDADDTTEAALASGSFQRNEARQRPGKNTPTPLPAQQSEQQDHISQNGTGKRHRTATLLEKDESRERHGRSNGTPLPAQQPEQHDDFTWNGTGKRRRKPTRRLISSDG